MGSHFGVGEFTTHFRTYFSGDWDVHWDYWIMTHGHMNLWLVKGNPQDPYLEIRKDLGPGVVVVPKQGCGIKGFLPTVIQGNPPYEQNSRWG